MYLVQKEERLISLSLEEIKTINEEVNSLQQYCSEPIDAVLFPQLTALLRIIEEEAQKGW